MDDPDSRVDGVDAAEETLFDVLGNATRLRILRQLLEAAGPGTDREALAFSELYDRVDYDTSANFSYHVDQLIDAGLVTRDDRGYAPSLLGTMLARKLLAGWTLLNPDEALDPTPIGAGCPRCGTAVALSYYGGVMRVHCPRCAETVDAERDRAHRSGDHPSPPPFLGMSVPPAGLAGRDAEGMFRTARAYLAGRERTHLDGVCPTCAARVTHTVERRVPDGPTEREPTPNGPGRDPLAVVHSLCGTCRTHLTLPVPRAIQTHPAVAAFYHDHDIDHDFASWATYRRAWRYGERIRSTDPLRVEVTVPCRGNRLRVTVDTGLTVVETDRESSPTG